MKLGLEVFLESKRHIVSGARVGLIVHPASVDHRLRHTADLFAAENDIRLTALFGPQHGIRGETQDNMIEWRGFRDPRLGLPVYSLYGETRVPSSEMLRDIDVLVFDLQDVGTRVYTFIWTMVLSMQAAKEHGKKFVVLDRPNPIGGKKVEGNMSELPFASFVGMYPLPMRHGMTAGELALYFNEAHSIHCDLDVVEMEGWRRDWWFDQTGLPWVLPSPNIPTIETAIVYPGMVLFEGTTVSEGRGTTRPFEIIGAPYINSFDLVERLNQLQLPGVYFRSLSFQPTFHKYAGEVCGGLQAHVLDREQFLPCVTAYAILECLLDLYPNDFAWKQPPYEYVFDRLPFDVICGTDRVRREIEKRSAPGAIDGLCAAWSAEFALRREQFLLYDSSRYDMRR